MREHGTPGSPTTLSGIPFPSKTLQRHSSRRTKAMEELPSPSLSEHMTVTLADIESLQDKIRNLQAVQINAFETERGEAKAREKARLREIRAWETAQPMPQPFEVAPPFDPSKLPKWQPEEPTNEPFARFKARFQCYMRLYKIPEAEQVDWLVNFCLPTTVFCALQHNMTPDIDEMWERISTFYHCGSVDSYMVERIQQLEMAQPHKPTRQCVEQFVDTASILFSQIADPNVQEEAMNTIVGKLPPVMAIMHLRELREGTLSPYNFLSTLQTFRTVFANMTGPAYSNYADIQPPNSRGGSDEQSPAGLKPASRRSNSRRVSRPFRG